MVKSLRFQIGIGPLGRVLGSVPMRQFITLNSRLKISVSTDISVLGFYRYIGDISMNIFT